jgi:hypothetical protein
MHGAGLGHRSPDKVSSHNHRAPARRALWSNGPCREHLYRAHQALFCHRCFKVFSDEGQHKTHAKANSCQHAWNKTRPDGLDHDQVKQLRRRRRGCEMTEDEKWVEMYKIAFPEDDPAMIPSPCECQESAVIALAGGRC